MSKYGNRPRVVYCASEEQARQMTAADAGSRALVTGPGTLAFHSLLAEHGAGVFETLHVAPAMRGKFRAPCGATIEEME